MTGIVKVEGTHSPLSKLRDKRRQKGDDLNTLSFLAHRLRVCPSGSGDSGVRRPRARAVGHYDIHEHYGGRGDE